MFLGKLSAGMVYNLTQRPMAIAVRGLMNSDVRSVSEFWVQSWAKHLKPRGQAEDNEASTTVSGNEEDIRI